MRGRGSTGTAWGALFGTSLALAGAPEWRAWEARRATFGDVVIHVQPIFDPARPGENTWVGRAANALHMPTREGVIRRALLFREGDRVRARQVYEAERVLRELAFIKEAHIDAEPMGEGRLRAHVWVRDAWTLTLDAGYSRTGDQGNTHFAVGDQNFLGSGKTVGLSYTRDHARTESAWSYGDPQLGGSRWALRAGYQDLSDGHGRMLALARPFYALDAPWSGALEGSTRKTNLVLRDRGLSVAQTSTWTNTVRLASAWAVHREEDRVLRAGIALTVDDHRYGPWSVLDPTSDIALPPLESRRQRGIGLTLEHQRDAFASFKDIRGMDTPEDYNLALGLSLEAGAFLRVLGSTRAGPYGRAALTGGWSSSPRSLSLFQGSVQGCKGGALKVDASLSTYLQLRPWYHLAGYVAALWLRDPDPEDVVYAGAREGFRGYPNDLHPGNGRVLLSLENRFFTEQRWWGLFRLGYVAFLDVGALHQLDGKGWSPLYPSAGLGLRLGDLKSSLARVITVSWATPLIRRPGQDRWLLGVESGVRF